jgi:hypothetical protein
MKSAFTTVRNAYEVSNLDFAMEEEEATKRDAAGLGPFDGFALPIILREIEERRVDAVTTILLRHGWLPIVFREAAIASGMRVGAKL